MDRSVIEEDVPDPKKDEPITLEVQDGVIGIELDFIKGDDE